MWGDDVFLFWQGELLYLPRGYVHHAVSAPGKESLHLTLSISRLHTWRDLLQVSLLLLLSPSLSRHAAFGGIRRQQSAPRRILGDNRRNSPSADGPPRRSRHRRCER